MTQVVLDTQVGQLTPEEITAAENKRQATAAFVIAVDLAVVGGLKHHELRAIVDSRPGR